MPHKRAKRSAREELHRKRGVDLAPGKESLYREVIPKSALRVLDAEKIRGEWKLKKRRLALVHSSRADKRQKVGSEDKGDVDSLQSSHWKIQPGEPMQHFNRRVEDGMRPVIKSALQVSMTTMRRNYRNDKTDMKYAVGSQQDASKMLVPSGPDAIKRRSKRQRSASPTVNATVRDTRASAKEFKRASASLPRRLNDVAWAPPSLTTLPRGTGKLQQGVDASKRDGVLSMAQRSLMDREREKAIQRYRLLKANQRA